MARKYGHIVNGVRLTTNTDDLMKVADNSNLSKKDYKVFLLLCCKLESENIIDLDVDQMAKTINLKKKDVDKSLTNLIYEGIIAEGSDAHTNRGYYFSYTTNGRAEPFRHMYE